MTDKPQPLTQVPLDRVTQALYAKIYSAMEPVRRALLDTELVTEQWASILREFHDSLPSLDVKAYVAFRAELGTLAELFGRAVRAPLSGEARALSLQIVLHDLPRVAAIATKLNEEEAPKFFAAISKEEPELAFRHFQSADVRAKTHVKKADLEQALSMIVNHRMRDAERLVREDLQRWLGAQGIDGPDLTVSADERPQYVFQRSGDAWKVVFEGNPEFHIPNTLGARYLDWLLHHPGEVISAYDLELKITPEKESVRKKDSIQHHSDPDAVRSYLREIDKLRALLDKAKESGDISEAGRLEEEIEAFEIEIGKKGRVKDAGERSRGNVGKAITAVKRRLAKGEKYEKGFGDHVSRLVSMGYTLVYNQPQGKIWQ